MLPGELTSNTDEASATPPRRGGGKQLQCMRGAFYISCEITFW